MNRRTLFGLNRVELCLAFDRVLCLAFDRVLCLAFDRVLCLAFDRVLCLAFDRVLCLAFDRVLLCLAFDRVLLCLAFDRVLCLAFWLSQGAQGVTLSVCLSGTSLSKALNLHLSLIGQSQVSSQVSSQVVPRSLSGLSLLSSSEGQSLKYLVLLTENSV